MVDSIEAEKASLNKQCLLLEHQILQLMDKIREDEVAIKNSNLAAHTEKQHETCESQIRAFEHQIKTLKEGLLMLQNERVSLLDKLSELHGHVEALTQENIDLRRKIQKNDEENYTRAAESSRILRDTTSTINVSVPIVQDLKQVQEELIQTRKQKVALVLQHEKDKMLWQDNMNNQENQITVLRDELSAKAVADIVTEKSPLLSNKRVDANPPTSVAPDVLPRLPLQRGILRPPPPLDVKLPPRRGRGH
ncbi:hypothetical protein BJ742DRAFT_329350 [Cladochytrium replicatum]|nr:hypothetical protein BJ742DRAFT_329350 [Cladochytrium replicatum]